MGAAFSVDTTGRTGLESATPSPARAHLSGMKWKAWRQNGDKLFSIVVTAYLHAENSNDPFMPNAHAHRRAEQREARPSAARWYAT